VNVFSYFFLKYPINNKKLHRIKYEKNGSVLKNVKNGKIITQKDLSLLNNKK
jgi:Zn-finger protein